MNKDLTFKIVAWDVQDSFVGPNVTMRAWDLPRIYVPTVMDIQPGSYMIVTGGGTFDPSTRAVSGGGTFTHYNFDGAVYCRGIWTVESFVSFDEESGRLIIAAKWKREWSPIPGFPPMVVGTLYLEISKDGWKLYGDSGLTNPVFNVIVSGHVHFPLHG